MAFLALFLSLRLSLLTSYSSSTIKSSSPFLRKRNYRARARFRMCRILCRKFSLYERRSRTHSRSLKLIPFAIEWRKIRRDRRFILSGEDEKASASQSFHIRLATPSQTSSFLLLSWIPSRRLQIHRFVLFEQFISLFVGQKNILNNHVAIFYRKLFNVRCLEIRISLRILS